MFHPDIVPMGHPVFDVISAAEGEANWDLRLACLLLLALNSSPASRGREDAYGSKRPHFLTEYADFLPSPLDCPSLLLSSQLCLLVTAPHHRVCHSPVRPPVPSSLFRGGAGSAAGRGAGRGGTAQPTRTTHVHPPLLCHGPQEELAALQDEGLAEEARQQQQRVKAFWRSHWGSDSSPHQLQRLAPSEADMLWAVGIVQSRGGVRHTPMGTVKTDTHMLLPYADMLNHSFSPLCSLHWRKSDRVMEVRVDAGHIVRAGTEVRHGAAGGVGQWGSGAVGQ
ncbi:unnamed protein product [Closterium sp. NIES-64]|nr:unnamed protein product [Closterium sp. NIES-64]